MRHKIYEIYGAKVEVVSMPSAVVIYKVIDTGVTCKIGYKTWAANAKKVEV